MYHYSSARTTVLTTRWVGRGLEGEGGMLLEASPRVPAIQYKPIITEATFPIFYPVRNLFSQKFPPIFILAEVIYYLLWIRREPTQRGSPF